MAKVKIRWTAEASDWLENIYGYIAGDSPQAAARVVDGIYKKVQLLPDHPQIGYFYRAVEDGEIRILLYGHYRIPCLLPNSRTHVDILGIFHSSLNIDRFFE